MEKEKEYFADINWSPKNYTKYGTNRTNSDIIQNSLGKFNLIIPPRSEFFATDNSVTINRKTASILRAETSLKKLLYASVKKRLFSDALLVSGGLDSSLLAKIIIDLGGNVKFVSCGFVGSNDMVSIDILEDALGIKVNRVSITDSSLIMAIKELKACGLDGYNCIMGVVELLCVKALKSAGSKNFMTGLGSDELFLGFDVHRTIARHSINSFVENKLYYMHAYDLLRLKRIATMEKIDFSLPYLDDKVIDFALCHDTEGEYDAVLDKKMLRDVAREAGLPNAIAERKKKAMQYGSGVVEALRRIATENHFKNVEGLIRNI